MDEVLQIINKDYIALDNAEVRYNNELLNSALKELIESMKNEDLLFRTLYEETAYGGSYYDGLRVGKPDEFDINLKLVVPECDSHRYSNCGCVTLIPSNKPGFFWFQVNQNYYVPFRQFIKDGYLQTDLVLNWFKGLVVKALNRYTSNLSLHKPTYYSESGPALTLRLKGGYGPVDIDLVPAFKFGSKYWPQQPYRANPSRTFTEFSVVPKQAKGMAHGERYWRTSFQDQEGELIESKQQLKPALRLLKKMRSNLLQLSISSYALKTIVLWANENGDVNWNSSLSNVFMQLLEKYKNYLNRKEIPYYWNKGTNLLDNVEDCTLINHYNEIARKINDIRNSNYQPSIVAKIILKEGSDEYKLLIIKHPKFR